MNDNIGIEDDQRLTDVSELHLGRVVRIKQQIAKNTDAKRLVCDVDMDMGGIIPDVPYYGCGVDKKTKFPHGIVIPPREDQQVVVGFIHKDWRNPVMCFPVPHPVWSVEEGDEKDFNNIMESLNDIALFHYSGSRIFLRADGTIELTKKIGSTEYKLSFSFSETKKTFTIKDLNNNNTIVLNEDGMKITDAFNNVTETTTNGVKITDKNNNTIEMKSGKVEINGSNLEILQ